MVAERDQAPETGIRERLDIHVLDTIAALIAGHGTTEGRRILSLSDDDGRAPAILADNVLDRIASRVALARHTEIDDIDIQSCVTPGAVATVTALTLAESISTHPRAITAAILAAYRVMTDLGRAAGGSTLLHRGYWPTYVVAPIGAAAATATLLGLDETATAHAMALALAQTAAAPGGPAEPNPRWLLLGLAARSGVVAAFAAARGVPGDPTLLDDDWLARCHAIELDRSLLQPQTADVLASMSIKPFASAKQAISAVDAYRQLLATHALDSAAIAEVRAYVLPEHLRMVGHDRVTASRSGRLTSVPHLIALATHAPDALLDCERALADTPAIALLRAKVKVEGDPSLTRFCPTQWAARVEITTTGGQALQHEVVAAKGDPGNAFTLDDAKTKLARVVQDASPDRRSELVSHGVRWLRLAGCSTSLGDWLAGLR
jgi:2-methylcitrate dehydratase PrpD